MNYEVEKKVWGDTQLIFKTDNISIHRLHIKAGGYCSIHHHEMRHNLFSLEQGELIVRQWGPDEITTLVARQTLVVKAQRRHQFEAVTPVVLYEIYYATVNQDDIVREALGGITGI